MSSKRDHNYLIQEQEEEEEDEEEAFLFAMQLATASVLPMVMKSTIELDLLELIKKAGPDAYVSPAELSSQLPTTNPEAHAMLDRMLSLLASYSVLNCKLKTLPNNGISHRVERVYGLAPVCKFLTKNEDGVSLAPLLLMRQDKVMMESWYHLKDAIVEGVIAFKKAHGINVFEYMGTDPRLGAIFNTAMSDHSRIVMKKVLQIYRGFEGLNSIVDVGGGIGTSLDMIVSRYPSIKGINFDLPHVVRDAPSYSGVEHVGGDMFVSVPKGEAIFIKRVCHDWNDEHALRLLKNCYEALVPSENGKVILVDSIIPVMPENGLSARNVYSLDMIMMAHLQCGSRERTEMEIQALAKGAGFKQFCKVFCVGDEWIMELRK